MFFLCISFSLSPSLPLQGCEVFGKAHGSGHGQEGESHHPVCHRDGQVARLCQNSLWNLQARFWRKGTLAPTLHHLIRKLNASLCVVVSRRLIEKGGIQRHHSYIRPLSHGLWLTKSSRCQLSTSEESVEEKKCVFCHSFFFSHAVKCRGLQARFNHWSVEWCSSLTQDPEAPLAVQICLEKEREEKKAKLNHTLCAFPPGHILFSLPVFPMWSIIQEEIPACKCVDVCVTESGCL